MDFTRCSDVAQARRNNVPSLWARLLSLLLALGCVAIAAPAIALSGAPVEINVILPLTGPGAFLGTQEQRAIAIAETVTNQRGGIRGRPVKFVYLDDQSSAPVTVQLANSLIAKKVPVILGSSISAMCLAIKPLVEKNGPVNYCFSPVVIGPPNSYVFSSSVAGFYQATTLLRYYREHGWLKIALITATDATGQDFEKELDRALALPENRAISIIDREHFAPTDITLSAQMARMKSANPQAVISYTTGSAFGTILNGYKESGMDLPILASGGNMIYAQMAQYKNVLPKTLLFAATRGVAPDPDLRAGPIKDAEDIYFKAFRAANVRPDFGSALAWDPTMLIIDGLRKLGPDTSAEALHNWIENLHGWAGIDALYDFRDGGQKGIAGNATLMYTWDAKTDSFIGVSRPGGAKR